MTGVPPDRYKAALRRFPSGVTVITCQSGGLDHAMTASAFTAVSLDPPLVLVCVNRRARFAEALAATSWWGVSILDAHGEDAARWFATSGRPLVGQLDRCDHHRGHSGVALLDHSLARLECRTEQVVAGGDHDIVVGAVTAVEISEGALPLLYWAGDYRELQPGPRRSGPGTA